MDGGETSFERVGTQPTTTRAAGRQGFDVSAPARRMPACGTPGAPPEGSSLARPLVHAAIQRPPSRAIRTKPFAARAGHEPRMGDLSAKPPWVSRAMHGMEQSCGRDAWPRHRISVSRLRPRPVLDQYSRRDSVARRDLPWPYARSDAGSRPRYGGKSPDQG